MMGEHGGRKKKPKKAKKAKASGGHDWSGCGAPGVLMFAIAVIVIYVFRDELGHLIVGLLQQLLGR